MLLSYNDTNVYWTSNQSLWSLIRQGKKTWRHWSLTQCLQINTLSLFIARPIHNHWSSNATSFYQNFLKKPKHTNNYEISWFTLSQLLEFANLDVWPHALCKLVLSLFTVIYNHIYYKCVTRVAYLLLVTVLNSKITSGAENNWRLFRVVLNLPISSLTNSARMYFAAAAAIKFTDMLLFITFYRFRVQPKSLLPR